MSAWDWLKPSKKAGSGPPKGGPKKPSKPSKPPKNKPQSGR